MNIIDVINKKIDLSGLTSLIYNSNLPEDSYIFKFRNPANLEKHLTYFYEIFKRYNIKKGDKILDIGSGLCYVDMICNALDIDCKNIELPSNSESEIECLYEKFHKILDSDVTYHKIKIPSDLPVDDVYDYIFIFNQTFDEKIVNRSITVWGVEQWKEFFKLLNEHLSPKGKIFINWSKQPYVKEDLDPIYNTKTNNTGRLLKYIHNKNYEYFLANKKYNVYYV
jgi:cyclopropane fatty-acyl-phospholipid synthase-like methyltransferase